MTQYKYVSVHEYTSGPKDGERFLKFGKAEAEASDIQLPTPDNDVDTMAEMERERVLVYDLPEQMTKSELKDWLDENRPDPVWNALDGEAAPKGSASETPGGDDGS